MCILLRLQVRPTHRDPRLRELTDLGQRLLQADRGSFIIANQGRINILPVQTFSIPVLECVQKKKGWREGGREGGEGGREGGREGWREGGMQGERQGERQGGRSQSKGG